MNLNNDSALTLNQDSDQRINLTKESDDQDKELAQMQDRRAEIKSQMASLEQDRQRNQFDQEQKLQKLQQDFNLVNQKLVHFEDQKQLESKSL